MTQAVSNPLIRSMILEPDLSEVGRARGFVREIAAEAGFSEERTFDMTVASSEAIANAIEHVPEKSHVTVRTLLYVDRLEVQVEGPGEFRPPRSLQERSSRGMGLPLMASLSDHLALFSGPRGGTLVTLTFRRPGAVR
jgi:anti-sigma regulatory factor (Ser/Thr protein kinase)